MTGKTGSALIAVMALAAATGCNDSTGPASGERAGVQFAAVTTGTGASVQGDALVLTGTNGTLRIDAMYAIMDEFELKRVEDDDCESEVDSCEEFEAPPAFIEIPMNGDAELAVQTVVDTGTYAALEFEIEDLDDLDEDDAAQQQQIEAVRAQVRAQFPDWPSDASLLVVGTFTPTGGAPIPFRVYFDAEIEVEKVLDPPVTVDGGNPVFTVMIDPVFLFRNGDGTVRNLAVLDFDSTGSVIEFEIEIENGISEIEYDD